MENLFQVLCIGLLGLAFGSLLAFSGYRFFLILLPIFGFIAGFLIGAHALQALFGTGFLIDVTSWVVGLVVGIVFAVLSYMFYLVGVAIFVGAFGYGVGVAVMHAIFNQNLEVITVVVGIVVAVVLVVVAFMFNFQKWIIVLLTAFNGASAIVGSILILFGQIPLEEIGTNPIDQLVNTGEEASGVLPHLADLGWFWVLMVIVIGVLGFIVQFQSTRNWELAQKEYWDRSW